MYLGKIGLVAVLLVFWTGLLRAQDECAPDGLVEDWETDFCTHSVEYDDIVNVLPRDAIPAILAPTFQSVEEAKTWLVDQSPVIALDIEGDARAYPQAILMWHEIVNDIVGGVPVAVTFCPLCNSSLVFDRRVGEQTLTFGVSGKLRNSDLIMYDHESDSWWQQFTGQGIVGIYTDTQLEFLPSLVIGFGEFAARYPQGQVLSPDTGYPRDYGRNPYEAYDSGDNLFLYSGEVDSRLPATEHVLAGLVDGQPIAYPFTLLREQKVINDTVNGLAVVAFWQTGTVSALDQARIDDSRDIGTAALYRRDLDGQTLTFTVGEDNLLHDEQTNSTWNVFGEAIAGEAQGSRLRQLLAAPHFWFAWAAFQPETLVYGETN
jgi:hypothetical protein